MTECPDSGILNRWEYLPVGIPLLGVVFWGTQSPSNEWLL